MLYFRQHKITIAYVVPHQSETYGLHYFNQTLEGNFDR